MVTFSEKGPLRATVYGRSREAREWGWGGGSNQSKDSVCRFQPLSFILPHPPPLLLSQELVIEEVVNPRLWACLETLRGLCAKG